MKSYIRYFLIIMLISILTLNLAGCKAILKADVVNNEKKIEENESNAKAEEVKEKIDALCNQLINADEENINKALKDFKENTLINVDKVYFAKEDSKKLYTYPVIEELPENYDPRKRIWYEKAKEDEYYISEEYTDVVTNKNMLTVAKALYKDEVCIGVVGVDLIAEEKN